MRSSMQLSEKGIYCFAFYPSARIQREFFQFMNIPPLATVLNKTSSIFRMPGSSVLELLALERLLSNDTLLLFVSRDTLDSFSKSFSFLLDRSFFKVFTKTSTRQQ